ncbi:hypothetical protein AYO40_02890 [Planctomycetaceae bacterium SCGC AG-212-D15]|nr:hypothetical protein AYO40_02890 [Planctomycetaceae bacterium SCGC AG-212-D15]
MSIVRPFIPRLNPWRLGVFLLVTSAAGSAAMAGSDALETGALLLGVSSAPQTPYSRLSGRPPSNFRSLRTDRGHSIIARAVEISDATETEVRAEDAWLKAQGLEAPIVRTGNPGPYSNCFGWIFTGGRYAIDTGIETILEDNGYETVSRPRPGDLVVYTAAGAAVHVAIVREVPACGAVIVESKWGARGRYHHPVHAYPLPVSFRCTYHRSARYGHQLRGLFDEDSPSRSMHVAREIEPTPLP